MVMSFVLRTAEELQEVERVIRGLEESVARKPLDRGLKLSLRSLVRRRSVLHQTFHEEAEARKVDVLTYRVFGDNSCKIDGGMRVFVDFQNALTSALAAVRHGPRKLSSAISAIDSRDSSLEVAFTFAGSLGGVFAIPRERVLIDEVAQDLSKAVEVTFDFCKAHDSDTIKSFSLKYGISVVRKLSRWVKTQAEDFLGSEIDWRAGSSTSKNLLVQPQELQALASLLDELSDESTETIEVAGSLFGLDTNRKTFHFEDRRGFHYSGKASNDYISFIVANPIHFPALNCVAKIERRHSVRFSTDEDKDIFTLVWVTPMAGSAADSGLIKD